MPNEAIAPSKPTRIRKTRPVLAPAPPPALQAQGMTGQPAAARPQPQSVQHPCAICGRPGVYQSRTAKVERGQQRPWYCRGEHEQWARKEDGEVATAAGMLPTMQPAAGAPNLRAALDLLSGEGE